MKPKDPIWNFYNALYDKKNISVRCLDCNAEVSAKLLRLMFSTLGRDEEVHFFLSLKYEYQNLAQYMSVTKTQPLEKSNRPLQLVLTSNDQY